MRLFILLGGAAMAAGFFLTWLEMPFAGPDLSPAAILRDSGVDIAEADWPLWVFLGGVIAAGFAALTALLGHGSALLALLAGLSPIVATVAAYTRLEEFLNRLGLPIPIDLGDIAGSWDLISDFIRVGFWAYLGGALVLLLAGLSVFASERR